LSGYRGKHEAEPQKNQKPKKPKKPGRLTGQQKVLIAVCVILVVALALVLGYRSLFVKPEIPNKPGTGLAKPNASGSGAEEIDYGDGVRPRVGGERKSENWYTILILGRDTGGGGNTDTMLLASYDVTNQKATVMSIPRDTMVNVPWDIKRINSVYNYYGGGEKGIQHVYKEISQLVGFEPDYQVVVEWEAVGQIVEAMGGVYFDVPQDMNYDDPTQDLHIHQAKGYRLLSGDDAMQVLRYRYDNLVNGKRKGYPDGDIGRIKTQQGLLKAMVSQLLRVETVTKIGELSKVFQENVGTDLAFNEILWFAQQAVLGGLKVDDVEFVTMPGNYVASCWSRSVGNYQSYVTAYPNQLLELVNTKLSPFVETFTLRDLDIMSINKDGSVSSSTGYVEDKKAAVPPEIPSDEPEIEDADGDGVPDDEDPDFTPPGSVTIGPNGEVIAVPDPGTTTPGTTTPGTTTPIPAPGPDPGITADPGSATDPGTITDPGITADPGTAADPAAADPGGIDWSVSPSEPGEPPV